jgi:biopolymer transport protein ExbD
MPRIKRKQVSADFQIAPMIDCVFLLLIYFIMTSTLKKQEADISFQLPGTVEQTEPVEMPDEQFIEIRADGTVVVNEYPYGNVNEGDLPRLAGMLNRFREANEANKSEAQVTIIPDDGTPHSGVVKVMDACSKAKIKSVNFALGDTLG